MTAPKWARMHSLFLDTDDNTLHCVERALLDEGSRFWKMKYLGLVKVNNRNTVTIRYHTHKKRVK